MTSPAWIAPGLAAVMLLIAACCAARLALATGILASTCTPRAAA